MQVPDEARTYWRCKSRRSNWEGLQLDHRTRFRLVRRSIWRPLQGASLFVEDSQGLNPGLSSVAPSGHNFLFLFGAAGLDSGAIPRAESELGVGQISRFDGI
jgi:hypothetical protein